MAQLDYPVQVRGRVATTHLSPQNTQCIASMIQNILDRVWTLWGDDVGRDTKVSAILENTQVWGA